MRKTKIAILMTSLIALTACGGGTEENTSETDIFEEASSWTNDQLLEKAKEETGGFVAYGNTSRITTAV